MSRGFTLLEVVISLVVLELAVTGAVGTLTLAAATLARAERLERGVALAEGVLDSLSGVSAVGPGGIRFGDGELEWSVDETGVLVLRAHSDRDGDLFELRSVIGRR